MRVDSISKEVMMLRSSTPFWRLSSLQPPPAAPPPLTPPTERLSKKKVSDFDVQGGVA